MSLILIPQETINSAREASAPRNTFEASHSPLPILFMALAIWAVIIAAVLWSLS